MMISKKNVNQEYAGCENYQKEREGYMMDTTGLKERLAKNDEILEMLEMLELIKPQLLLNSTKMKSALRHTAVSVFDMIFHCRQICALEGLYNEYMYYCLDDAWHTFINITDETEELLQDASCMLHRVVWRFSELYHLVMRRLEKIMKAFLAADRLIQTNVFGFEISVEPEEHGNFIDGLSKLIWNAPYSLIPEENYQTFLELLRMVPGDVPEESGGNMPDAVIIPEWLFRTGTEKNIRQGG